MESQYLHDELDRVRVYTCTMKWADEESILAGENGQMKSMLARGNGQMSQYLHEEIDR